MSDVQFDTDQPVPMSTTIGFTTAENKMAEWLMRRGIVRSESQAQYVLLGIAGLALLIGIASWFLLNPRESADLPQDQIDAMFYPAPGAAANSTNRF